VKHVFIVGCPRSGSTWATFLLAQHEKVATFQHAKIFDYLVWMQRWYRNKAGYSFVVDPSGETSADGKNLRLASLLPEADFYPMLRPVAEGILASVAGLRPGVEVVVDKTPENGHLAEFILRVLPDAHFLHIVRDPRSTYCSHRSASKGWARWEFPTQPVDGGRFWKRDVEAALAIRDLTDNYVEVRYEDLKANGPAELQRLFEWAGLAASPELCEAAVAASSKDKVRTTKELPSGFVRKVPKGGWRDELSAGDARILEYLTGDLMQRLGYELSQPPAASAPLRVRVRDTTEPVLDFVEKKLHRLTQLAHWRWVGRKLEWLEP
jgi:hypothetical protein